MRKYVLTGGPGIGKTTLIDLLAMRGYRIVPEAARMIIKEEKLKGSNILPSGDLEEFQRLVAERQIELEERSDAKEIFCDRGIIDGYAYCKIGNVPIPKQIIDMGKNRYDKVFLLSPLSQYNNDDIRIEHSTVAEDIHRTIASAYLEFGYHIIHVPVLSPEERVNYILKLTEVL
ncbi:MAG TPA: ATP-binding protein [Candidatus Paceibacterota bacterium]